jgi:hypothetical protein
MHYIQTDSKQWHHTWHAERKREAFMGVVHAYIYMHTRAYIPMLNAQSREFRQTYIETDRLRDRQTSRQTDFESDRQQDRQEFTELGTSLKMDAQQRFQRTHIQIHTYMKRIHTYMKSHENTKCTYVYVCMYICVQKKISILQHMCL